MDLHAALVERRGEVVCDLNLENNGIEVFDYTITYV